MATLTMLESSIDSSGPASSAYWISPARSRRARAVAGSPAPATPGRAGAIRHHRRPRLGEPLERGVQRVVVEPHSDRALDPLAQLVAMRRAAGEVPEDQDLDVRHVIQPNLGSTGRSIGASRPGRVTRTGRRRAPRP